MEIIASILFGLLPESIYFTLFLTYAKGLKTKRWLLFLLILAVSVGLSAFLSYSVWYHAALLAAMFAIMWILYRSQIIDVFLIVAESLILVALGLACYFLIPNYTAALIVNRVAMFATVLALRHHLPHWYAAYCSLWNRRKNAKVKSITVRNISVIVLNVMLYVIAVGMIFFSTQLLNKTGGAGMIWSYFGFCDSEDGE